MFCLPGLSQEAIFVAISANKHIHTHTEMGIFSHISVQGVPKKNVMILLETLKVGFSFFFFLNKLHLQQKC